MTVYSSNAIVYDCGDLEGLRFDVGTWASRNFGHTLPEKDRKIYGMLRCASGMDEELSELIENSDQLTPCPFDREESLDAIADICIYALDFLYTASITMQTVLLYDREQSRWEKEFMRATTDTEGISELVDSNPNAPVCIIHVGLAVLLGKLQHSVLKKSQKIRGKEDHMEQIMLHMCHVWRLCYRLSAFWKKDLNELVKETAAHVLKRDWIANPDHAHEVDNANR